MVAKKKGAGGSLTRSQVVTVRLDPKLRYLAELAALKQRRTLSSYIEWAIQDSLSRIFLSEGSGFNNDHGNTLQDEGDMLWDVDEPDRFAKLAFHHPELLMHNEQIKWKLIRENGLLWRGKDVDGVWQWSVREEGLILDRLRKYWEQFCAVAEGDQDASVLPSWSSRSKVKTDPPPETDLSNEVPF